VAATGGRERRFTAPGAAIADQHGAALFALGIVGAYAKWLRTGEGTRVESSLLASGIDLQTESLVTYFAADGQDRLFERDSHLGTWFHEAPYGIYALKDAHVAISINPPEKVARALKSDKIAGLIGRNTYHERDVYAQAVAEALAGLTFAELAQAFESEAMWFAKVDTFDDLVQNPQVLYNGTFMDFDVMGTPLKLVNHPNRYDGEGAEIRHMAFHQGQHSRMILDECGYSSKEIAQFHENEIVFSPKD
jgi:crotonobetainyl-CoA:carnitine CoA-transferase CaiB-like acyl-CoA transferase